MNRSQVIEDSKKYNLFSWTAQKTVNPLPIERAEGVYLYEFGGKKLLDFSSGLMSVNIGHGNKYVLDAINKQMQNLCYVAPTFTTEIRAKLSKKLSQICPGNLNKSFFTLCGASSIDNAVKLARLYTNKHKIFGRYRSFHGASSTAMAVGGDPRKQYCDAQQATNIFHFDDPYDSYGLKMKDDAIRVQWSLDYIERLISYEGSHTIAAFIFEGESGTSGCLHYPQGYLSGVKKILEKHNILFIADEVMSGFARTGKWFGFEHSEFVPDMVCMAKGLTSSYVPLGCVMVSDTIAEYFDDHPLWLGLTYNAHPVSLAAALAVIEVYENEGLIQQAVEKGKYIEKCVAELRAIHPSIGEFRNKGLLGCLDIVKNHSPYELSAPFNANAEQMSVMSQVNAKLKELGLYTFVRWGHIFIAPPLTIKKSEINEGLEIISKALKISDAYVENKPNFYSPQTVPINLKSIQSD